MVNCHCGFISVVDVWLNYTQDLHKAKTVNPPPPPTSSPVFPSADEPNRGLICFLFRPIHRDNKHCTGNYNNYNNLIMVMRMIMTRTAWTQMLRKIKYIPDTHDLMLIECVCGGNTVVLRLNPRTCLPGNTLILPKKIKDHHSEV